MDEFTLPPDGDIALCEVSWPAMSCGGLCSIFRIWIGIKKLLLLVDAAKQVKVIYWNVIHKRQKVNQVIKKLKT